MVSYDLALSLSNGSQHKSWAANPSENVVNFSFTENNYTPTASRISLNYKLPSFEFNFEIRQSFLYSRNLRAHILTTLTIVGSRKRLWFPQHEISSSISFVSAVNCSYLWYVSKCKQYPGQGYYMNNDWNMKRKNKIKLCTFVRTWRSPCRYQWINSVFPDEMFIEWIAVWQLW